MDNGIRNPYYLRLVYGGAEASSQKPPTLPPDTNAPRVPRWQLVVAVASKIILLASLYYLIRG